MSGRPARALTWLAGGVILLVFGALIVSALPIVGTAPILVMWFGFDWQSKAAVVAVMCFFPMLVNTVAGLAAATGLYLKQEPIYQSTAKLLVRYVVEGGSVDTYAAMKSPGKSMGRSGDPKA